MTTVFAVPRRNLVRLALGAILAASAATNVATPALAEAVCMPRVIAQNIEDAVTALTASKYCKGLPYTIADASRRVDEMRACNQQASTRIDDMINGNDERYRNIYVNDPMHVACQAAATIAIN